MGCLMLHRAILTIVIFLQLTTEALGQNLSNRLPEPTPAEIAAARKEIHEIFGKELDAANASTARKILSDKLLKLANDAKETPANRWVLYGEARTLAAFAGDVVLARRSLDDHAIRFAVESRLQLAAETAEQLAKGPSLTGVGNKPLLDFVYAVAEQAIEVDDFKICVRMLNLGLKIARSNPKDTVTIQRFQLRRQAAEELAKIFDDAKKDEATMGKYLCFQKGDWKNGLLLLAKQKNEELAAVAVKDSRNPTEGKEQIDLADAWFELSNKSKGDDRRGMLRRAMWWYRKGISRLGGLAKAKVEGKITAATEEFDKSLGLKRHLWVGEQNRYKLVDVSVWEETMRGGGVVKFIETDRTKDYIEMIATVGAHTYLLRLTGSTVLAQVNAEPDFNAVRAGKWID